MTSPLSSAIQKLSDAAPEVRAAGAAELYRKGRELAERVVKPWRADAELATLLGGDRPQITVGVGVSQETFARIRAANGSPRLAKVPPEQDAAEFELHFSGGASLDILTSRDLAGSGAIARYLAKMGEGIQQVEYCTIDVDRATQIVQERLGVQPVYAETRPGADGTRVNFFLSSSAGGEKVLIEFYERAGATR
jgi:hypothetical protein